MFNAKCCKQCRQDKSQKHTEQQDVTDIQSKLCVCVCVFSFPIFTLGFRFLKTISSRNVELPPRYGQWLSLGV